MYIKSFCIKLFISLSILLFICEFLVYYITIFQCNWPNEKTLQTNGSNPVKVMLIADTHLLGPFRGHWFDKMRREWQMHRAFQTAMTIFHPEIVFVLGDLFDEGNWVNQNEFQEYCERFQKLFYTPKETSLYSLAGNHDIGFHYNTNPTLVNRFDKFFNSSGVDLISRRGVHFVSIDSMAMEGDGCFLCDKAERLLRKISERFKCSKVRNCNNGNELLDGYSQPIILQHFPMYRKSDEDCLEHDSPEIENFREKWEVLSKESTDLLGNLLQPRLALSGHSHHYCKLVNRLKIEEYTLSSFSWRNKNNPSFILATFSPIDYKISRCLMPEEMNVYYIYIFGGILALIVSLIRFKNIRKSRKLS